LAAAPDEVEAALVGPGGAFSPAGTFSSFSFTAGLSLKSKQVHRPLFRGSVVATLTILNLSLKSCGPTRGLDTGTSDTPPDTTSLTTAMVPATGMKPVFWST
jgi:hypothetical protein